ncbi:MAG TPA: HIT family protein [Blastocatellia bacterium]|nr:HIT family protein [Blastocatellia bacterium]
MGECVFCSIVAGRRPASFVYRDEACSAFMDIRPVNPGHVLVIPNGHSMSLADLSDDCGPALFQLARRVAQAVRKSGLRCEGVNLWLADGEAAGQEVFHVHIHILPRYRGDGFKLSFGPEYGKASDRRELERTAARIRDALPGQAV